MLKSLSYKIINIVTLVRRFFRTDLYLVDVQNPHGTVSDARIMLLAADIHKQFGIKEFIGVAWRGGKSDHEKGLALDIIPNCFPFAPRLRQRKNMDALYDYLITNSDTYNITYVIWQNTIAERPTWTPKQNIKHTHGRTPSELHVDHIHVSFMKEAK